MYILCGCIMSFAFGEATNAIIILNLPAGFLRSLICGMFVIAVVLTFPYQFLIGTRIVEDAIFRRVDRPSFARKAKKTCFRWMVVCLLAVTAVVGNTSFDHFLSLIGAVCGIPIAIIFPILRSMKLNTSSAFHKGLDVMLFWIGMVCLGLCTYVTLAQWASSVA